MIPKDEPFLNTQKEANDTASENLYIDAKLTAAEFDAMTFADNATEENTEDSLISTPATETTSILEFSVIG